MISQDEMFDDECAPSALETIKPLLEELEKKEREVKDAEERLEKAKKELDDISGNQIPRIFDELGLSEIKTSDGKKVSVATRFAASITKEKADGCFSWLDRNGHGSLAKKQLVFEETPELIEVLMERAIPFSVKRSVHPKSLEAFVKEQKESGAEFPDELFSVFVLRKTKVK